MIRQMSRILSRFTRLTLHLRPSYHRFISAGHTMDVIPPCGIDPNNYTSGRRLRHDKVQRELRFIRINFGALCRRVLELCPGADSIAKCQKIEGAFNRVLIFTLNNDKRVVARLPFALAGPSRLTTASEVATIKYLQAKTNIPIPTILGWSDDSKNAEGSEYIIMEHAKGVQLHKKWPEMAGDQQVNCINAIYQKVKEMVNLKFPYFGSLYLLGHVGDSSFERPLDEGFCVGPHCGRRYWDCNGDELRYYHNTNPNQGPWHSLDKYHDGLIDAGLSRVPPTDSELQKRPLYHGTIQAHLSLLQCARVVLKKMCKHPRIQAAATPVLFHSDLHKRNIFVSEDDPAVVTDIIDWQSTSVEPAYWYADEVPDFASPTESKNDYCFQTFDACSQFLTPKLAGPRLMDDRLFRPFRYSYRTWKDGAVALRHELIETSRGWKELGLAGSSPYPLPSPQELLDHEKNYKLFVAAQNLKRDLSNLLNAASDGWVPSESWVVTDSAHREVFDRMLSIVLANESPEQDELVKEETDLRSIWPFDLKTQM